MLQKYKVAFAIAGGLALLALLPIIVIVVIAIRQIRHVRQEEGIPEPTNVPLLNVIDTIPESYWVIGPFGPGLHQSYEPEQQPDPARSCKTPGGEERKWMVKSVIPKVKCLDFRKAFELKQTDDSAAYALVYVRSPKDQPGEMLLGSDDTITVWVNGVQVHQNTKLRPGRPDDDQVSMAWKEGWNTVLIKVGNGKGDQLFFAKLRAASELRVSTTKDMP